jgi:hypothetical protein
MTSFLREVAAKDQRPSEWREREEAALFHDADATDMAHDAAHALAENRSGAVRYGFATQVVVVMDEDAERAACTWTCCPDGARGSRRHRPDRDR